MDFQLDLLPEDEHGIVQLRGGAKLKQATKTNPNKTKPPPDQNNAENPTNKTSSKPEVAPQHSLAQSEIAPMSQPEQQQ